MLSHKTLCIYLPKSLTKYHCTLHSTSDHKTQSTALHKQTQHLQKKLSQSPATQFKETATQRLCCRLIHLMWMRLTRTSVTSLRKQPKRLSHAGIETTIFRVGMQSVNPSIKPFCSLLRETTQVWLLQLCLPSLTENGGIDGPKQFGALTSHTLVEKRGVF